MNKNPIVNKKEFEIYGLIPKVEVENLYSKNFKLQLPNISLNEKDIEINPVVFRL